MLQNNVIIHGELLKSQRTNCINPGSDCCLRLAACVVFLQSLLFDPPNASLHAGTHVPVHGLASNFESAAVDWTTGG